MPAARSLPVEGVGGRLFSQESLQVACLAMPFPTTVPLYHRPRGSPSEFHLRLRVEVAGKRLFFGNMDLKDTRILVSGPSVLWGSEVGDRGEACGLAVLPATGTCKGCKEGEEGARRTGRNGGGEATPGKDKSAGANQAGAWTWRQPRCV